jgi:hypothetical protein
LRLLTLFGDVKASAQQIDDAVIASSLDRWSKVAMIICRAANYLGPTFQLDDAGCEMILDRVEELVRSGRLIVQGDIRKPRYSEVRLP